MAKVEGCKGTKIKVCYKDDIRLYRCNFDESIEMFHDLLNFIMITYSFSDLNGYGLTYKDNENDYITIVNESDLMDCVLASKVLKILPKIYLNKIKCKTQQIGYTKNVTNTCPGKHGLYLFYTPHNRFYCDGCNKSMKLNDALYGCRKCDYDLCLLCNNKDIKASNESKDNNDDNKSNNNDNNDDVIGETEYNIKIINDISPVQSTIFGSTLKCWEFINNGCMLPKGMYIKYINGDIELKQNKFNININDIKNNEKFKIQVSIPTPCFINNESYKTVWQIFAPNDTKIGAELSFTLEMSQNNIINKGNNKIIKDDIKEANTDELSQIFNDSEIEELSERVIKTAVISDNNNDVDMEVESEIEVDLDDDNDEVIPNNDGILYCYHAQLNLLKNMGFGANEDELKGLLNAKQGKIEDVIEALI